MQYLWSAELDQALGSFNAVPEAPKSPAVNDSRMSKKSKKSKDPNYVSYEPRAAINTPNGVFRCERAFHHHKILL